MFTVQKTNWNFNELEEICGSIFHHDSSFGLSNFINYQFAYVIHVRNCVYLGYE